MKDEYCYLCCNCGVISDANEFERFMRDLDTGELRAPEPGESDPILVCPACDHGHVDDDSNPGIEDGTREQLEHLRTVKYFGDESHNWGETWAHALIEAHEKTPDDPRPHVFVFADHNPDDTRHFYEIPDAVRYVVLPPGSQLTFVEGLAHALRRVG